MNWIPKFCLYQNFTKSLCFSDSTLLMADSFLVLKQLKDLQHLSLSRCYHIHLAALT